jgi:hypothetical protein
VCVFFCHFVARCTTCPGTMYVFKCWPGAGHVVNTNNVYYNANRILVFVFFIKKAKHYIPHIHYNKMSMLILIHTNMLESSWSHALCFLDLYNLLCALSCYDIETRLSWPLQIKTCKQNIYVYIKNIWLLITQWNHIVESKLQDGSISCTTTQVIAEI